eukprot:GHVO01050448.1.p1 GENE.GHVO01050448.1~~GHVO01050448.1.p1  ORF type:complete len:572 (+),score=68.34 GHVO01050448.1:55-1770(+)
MILHIVVNRSPHTNDKSSTVGTVSAPSVTTGPSFSAYITYADENAAAEAVKEVSGAVYENRQVRASFGTTKYCSFFLRGLQCTNSDCFYLHELGPEKDSFTKEEMCSSKHTFTDMTCPFDSKGKKPSNFAAKSSLSSDSSCSSVMKLNDNAGSFYETQKDSSPRSTQPMSEHPNTSTNRQGGSGASSWASIAAGAPPKSQSLFGRSHALPPQHPSRSPSQQHQTPSKNSIQTTSKAKQKPTLPKAQQQSTPNHASSSASMSPRTLTDDDSIFAEPLPPLPYPGVCQTSSDPLAHMALHPQIPLPIPNQIPPNGDQWMEGSKYTPQSNTLTMKAGVTALVRVRTDETGCVINSPRNFMLQDHCDAVNHVQVPPPPIGGPDMPDIRSHPDYPYYIGRSARRIDTTYTENKRDDDYNDFTDKHISNNATHQTSQSVVDQFLTKSIPPSYATSYVAGIGKNRKSLLQAAANAVGYKKNQVDDFIANWKSPPSNAQAPLSPDPSPIDSLTSYTDILLQFPNGSLLRNFAASVNANRGYVQNSFKGPGAEGSFYIPPNTADVCYRDLDQDPNFLYKL